MADPLASVKAGNASPFLNNTDTCNAVLENARRTRDFRQLTPSVGAPGVVLDALTPSTRVLIRNDTGSDLSAGDIVKIGDAVTPYLPDAEEDGGAENEHEFRRNPVFIGTQPTATTDFFAILSEPAAAYAEGVYGFARAVTLGDSVCDVNITDASHNYATPRAGDFTQLTSAASGPVYIRAKESTGTGTKKCAVFLMGQATAVDTAWFWAEITGGTDAGGYSWKRKELSAAGTWSDAGSPSPLTGSSNAWRAPSATTTSIPAIPSGQVVLIRPSPTTADSFEVDPWGGRESVAGTIGPYLTDVTISTNASAVCNGDGTITVTITNTLTKTSSSQAITVIARDASITLPAPS